MKNWQILLKHKLPKEPATADRYFVLVEHEDRSPDKFGFGYLNVGYEKYSSLQVYSDRWFSSKDGAKEQFQQKLQEILGLSAK
jgi:hypothetical protein